MKILVCVSKVPDTTSKINFTDNNTRFDSNGVQWIINPYDEWYALVRAIELKEEKGGDSKVVVIHVGPKENEQIIRKALAIGADEAVRVDMEALDTYNTAFQIAEYARNESFDLILTGKETIDYNGAALAGMLAGMLDLPFVSFASKLDIENEGTAILRREIEGGEEVVEAPLPLMVSAQKGMAEARIPSMRGIMQARTKPLTVVPPKEAPVLTSIIKYEKPAAKSGCTYIDPEHPEKLIELLHNEAKVI